MLIWNNTYIICRCNDECITLNSAFIEFQCQATPITHYSLTTPTVYPKQVIQPPTLLRVQPTAVPLPIIHLLPPPRVQQITTDLPESPPRVQVPLPKQVLEKKLPYPHINLTIKPPFLPRHFHHRLSLPQCVSGTISHALAAHHPISQHIFTVHVISVFITNTDGNKYYIPYFQG